MAEHPARAALPGGGWQALAVAGFELRLQLRSPTFWIVVAISALMVLGSLLVERIQVGPRLPGPRNAAAGVIHLHLVWSLFFLFTATAFATDAALRDRAADLDQIIRATPVRSRNLALGRFVGSTGATLLAFLSVPAAAFIAPWLASGDALPATDPGALLYGYLVFGAPNLVLACALFLALAAATSSAMAAYLGAVALLVLYGLGADGQARGPGGVWAAVLEPFGFGAYLHATAGWSAAERAERLPPLVGPLIWNRLLWTAVGCGCAVFATRVFGRIPSPRSRVPAAKALDEAGGRAPGRRPVAEFGAAARLAQLFARTRLETGLVLRSPFLLVLLLLGMASAVAALWPTLGATASAAGGVAELVQAVDEAFRLVPVVVATFYAGELVWGERDSRMHEIVGATPIPDGAYLAPKVLALVLVLGALFLASAAAGVAMQVLRAGGHAVDALPWLTHYTLPRTFDLALVAALAVFFQAVSPGKLVGFGWMTLYFVASVALESAGFDDDLYRFGGHAETLSADRAGSAEALLVRAYWGALAIVLLTLGHQIIGRGTEGRLGPRLARLPRRLRGAAGVIVGAGLVAFIALGTTLSRTSLRAAGGIHPGRMVEEGRPPAPCHPTRPRC